LTELSGRGVGMDVVRTNIEEIRGKIQVKTTLGMGTTFTIRVPFALSILRVMLLERAGFVFAVSVDSVQEIIRFQPGLLTADGTHISWQSQTIPLIALEQGVTFGRDHRPFKLSGIPTIAQTTLLVVGEDQLSTAFYIDRFWGEKEVTLRSIDSPIPLTPGFGNSIILGDGRVVPLVNLVQLAAWMSVNAEFLATGQDSNRSRSVIIERTQQNRILVIDDSINIRRYLTAMLEKEGYEVEQAKDGQEAVEKLAGGLVVQAVICDVEMPRLDGYGVLESLRANEAFENLPIVMLTSRNSDKHRSLAMNLGASAYFSKPYTEPELLSSLKSLIEMM
jgi:two-component system, chemotaxis family, sensor histidine kinase and response regulator PixL